MFPRGVDYEGLPPVSDSDVQARARIITARRESMITPVTRAEMLEILYALPVSHEVSAIAGALRQKWGIY